MAKFMTDVLKHKIIDALRGTSFSVDALELALYTVAPTTAGGGTEVTGGSYSAQDFTLDTPASGTADNVGQIQFLDMPGVTVTAAAVRDKLTHEPLWVNDGLSIVCAAGSNKAVNAGELDLSFPAVA